MTIIYRQQKGEPLTIAEMDGNFADLQQRVKVLETAPAMAEGIQTITQERDQVTFHGTLGTVLGQVKLPKVFPNPRGKWQPETAYGVLDWVQVERRLYSCRAPHTSRDFQEDQACWGLVCEL
jgi:hypothetical protein